MPEEQVQIQLESALFYAGSANIVYGEEEFMIVLTSGNSARRYLFSPKHAKRMMLLLQQNIQDYEKKFGELKTELPKVTGESSEKKMGF